MPRIGKVISAAWQYFIPVEGGAQCQIDSCNHKFLKRASGSSTKFLWSHLEAHHRELAKELGRQGKKRKRITTTKNKLVNGRTETIDIHCYPSSSSQMPPQSFVYSQNSIPSNSNTMNMNLMDLIANDTSSNTVNTTNNEQTPSQHVSVNDYFCKMLSAQLNQMTEKQAHMVREKIQAYIGHMLYNDHQQPSPHKMLPFNQQQYS